MRYRDCRTAEADVGMLYYLSTTDGTGGRLKTLPEDFVVREISDRPPEKKDGRFTIADVTSTNWETNRLVRLLARTLNISREKVCFAGTKDKRAVTTQLMSFECPPDRLSTVELKDLRFENAYTAGRSIKIGDLIGNEFDIRVKEPDIPIDKVGKSLDQIISIIKETGGFPNYFGVQRFGTSRPITHKVGEMIVRGDIRKAVEIYLSAPSEFEGEDVMKARSMLAECNEDYSSVIQDMPKTMGFEKTLAEHLIRKPGDYIGAINEMPTNLQMMFTHAYQSYLFNLMLSERMRREIPLNRPIEGDIVIPLNSDRIPAHENPIVTTTRNIDLVTKQVSTGKAFISITLYGVDSVFAEGEMGEIERSIIQSEKLEEKDFIVPGLTHCSSKGSRREILCPLNDVSYNLHDDGYSMAFSLPKGNYATCLMREFMKSDMNRY